MKNDRKWDSNLTEGVEFHAGQATDRRRNTKPLRQDTPKLVHVFARAMGWENGIIEPECGNTSSMRIRVREIRVESTLWVGHESQWSHQSVGTRLHEIRVCET